MKIIIGITGTIGAGKGTVSEYLVKQGFKHFSAREDVINKELLTRGLEINRDNMVAVANDLRVKHGPSYVAERLFEMAEQSNANCVLESLRTEGEIISLRKKGEFYLFAIDAKQKTRYERVQIRKNSQSDDVGFEKFKSQEKTEMTSNDPTKQNLQRCIEIADYIIENNDSIETLYEKVDEILNKINQRE